MSFGLVQHDVAAIKSWELGAESWELGAESWEPGAGS
jgi:hypothetical protein